MTVQKLFFLLILSFVILFNIVVPFVSATTDKDHSCLAGTKCHGEQSFKKILDDGTIISLYVDKNQLDDSVHKKQSCIDCHIDITQIPHSENIQRVRCEQCHYAGNTLNAPDVGQVREYYEDIHGGLHENPLRIKEAVEAIESKLGVTKKSKTTKKQTGNKFCHECGEEIKKVAKFCQHCGKKQ